MLPTIPSLWRALIRRRDWAPTTTLLREHIGTVSHILSKSADRTCEIFVLSTERNDRYPAECEPLPGAYGMSTPIATVMTLGSNSFVAFELSSVVCCKYQHCLATGSIWTHLACQQQSRMPCLRYGKDERSICKRYGSAFEQSY